MKTTVVVYSPRQDREIELRNLLAQHADVLESEGLLGERSPAYFVTPKGMIVEIFDWKSEKAGEDAHSRAAIQTLWNRLGEASEFVSLGQLDIASQLFASMERIELKGSGKGRERSISDTIIAAQNYDATVEFYRSFVGLKVARKSDEFCLLEDPSTKQVLCVTNGPSVAKVGTSVQTGDLVEAVSALEKLGGKVVRTWEFGSMAGANAHDPEGNELLIWKHLGDREVSV